MDKKHSKASLIFVQEHYKFKSTVWGDIFLNSSDTILHSYKLIKGVIPISHNTCYENSLQIFFFTLNSQQFVFLTKKIISKLFKKKTQTLLQIFRAC